MFVVNGCVPTNFGKFYTVPIPNGNVSQHVLTAEDFSGISISPATSKLFEHAVFVRFSRYFVTSEYQFGFKKSLRCRHAIYCVRNVIEHYVNNGSTVNVCSL